MRKTIFTVACVLLGLSANAQQGLYVGFSGGPTFKAAASELSSTEGSLKGSYGAGIEAQLRTGFMFTDKIGVELGLGYLHGNKAEIIKNEALEITGKARAYGAALVGVYNFTNNFYSKAGLLTKIGGKTIIEGKYNGLVKADFVRHNTGKMPLGFTASLGAKMGLTTNLELFGEVQYQGISVTSDKSKYVSGSFNYNGTDYNSLEDVSSLIKLAVDGGMITSEVGNSMANLAVSSLAKEITYVEGTPDPAKYQAKAVKAPYSSIGVVVGIRYNFL